MELSLGAYSVYAICNVNDPWTYAYGGNLGFYLINIEMA